MTHEVVMAAAYWRMSTDRQEDSIPRQQETMFPLCQREGISIEKEFKDQGRSGTTVKRRDEFVAMLEFCKRRQKEGRPISVIVCLETSRFSRGTMTETFHYIHEFMQCGVTRIFTSERWFNLHDEQDRLLLAVQQDFTNHKFSKQLSSRVSTGKRRNFVERGNLNGGVVHYGFDKLLLNERGEVMQRLPRTDKAGYRPEGWRVTLAPTENQEERDAVLWIYKTYAEYERSFRSLAAELNKRGVPGPGSRRGVPGWDCDAIQRILTNPVYVGDYVWGRRAIGKFSRMVEGSIQEGVFTGRYNNKNPLCRKQHFEAIIERDLWEKVQRKIQLRRVKRRCVRPKTYPLTGLLYCGVCSATMGGSTRNRGNYRLYACSLASHKPGMKPHTIREDKVMPVLVRKLQEIYLAPANLEKLRQELSAKSQRDQTVEPDKAARLRKALNKLDGEIVVATRNILRSTDNLDLLQAELTSLRHKRDDLAAQLAEHEHAISLPQKQGSQRVNEAIAVLESLRDELTDAPVDRLRELFRRFITRMDIYFEEEQRTINRRFRFVRGVVQTRLPDEFLLCDAHVVC